MTESLSPVLLKQALDFAIAVALDAGKKLRDEWHRPSGPRGMGSQAEIDVIIETSIRAKLLDEFPEWGFQGEETRPHLFPDGQPYWCVDPNDGTIEYVKGTRGSTVSIGLIYNHQPVLGVVFSPMSPDDDGDLFTWCEGEPACRNGNLLPMLSSDVMVEDQVMLAAMNADKKFHVNLMLIAPARFRIANSIAHRLALTAAGEADIGVSINNPKSWDIAAGHAILRGVGGIVCSELEQPIEYTAHGELTHHGKWLYGGHPSIISMYADNSWEEIFKVKPDITGLDEPPYPTRLIPGLHFRGESAILRRAHGCLIGQLAGDALGTTVAYRMTDEISSRYPEGQPLTMQGEGAWDTLAGQLSDASELALMLARSIVSGRCYDAETAARYYTWWFRSDPFDVGNTLRNALEAATEARFAVAVTAIAAASRYRMSEASGALMRVAPLGIYGWQMNPDTLAEDAMLDAQLTHASPVCLGANAVFAIAIASAIRTGDRNETYQTVLRWAKIHAIPAVTDAITAAQSDLPVDYLSNKGWVLVALQNAFYHFLRDDKIEPAIEATIRRGGDADTNAAICGALLGALLGREAIPLLWRKMLLSCHPADGFAHIQQPRPPAAWGTDAETLAELLLVSGLDK